MSTQKLDYGAARDKARRIVERATERAPRRVIIGIVDIMPELPPECTGFLDGPYTVAVRYTAGHYALEFRTPMTRYITLMTFETAIDAIEYIVYPVMAVAAARARARSKSP